MTYLLLILVATSSYLAYKVVKVARQSRKLIKEEPIHFKKYSTVSFEHDGRPETGMVLHQIREIVVIRLKRGQTITKHKTCCTLT